MARSSQQIARGPDWETLLLRPKGQSLFQFHGFSGAKCSPRNVLSDGSPRPKFEDFMSRKHFEECLEDCTIDFSISNLAKAWGVAV